MCHSLLANLNVAAASTGLLMKSEKDWKWCTMLKFSCMVGFVWPCLDAALACFIDQIFYWANMSSVAMPIFFSLRKMCWHVWEYNCCTRTGGTSFLSLQKAYIFFFTSSYVTEIRFILHDTKSCILGGLVIKIYWEILVQMRDFVEEESEKKDSLTI